MPSGSTQVVTNYKISFFFMSNIPLYIHYIYNIYVSHSLSIHLLMGTLVALNFNYCNNAVKNIGVYLF